MNKDKLKRDMKTIIYVLLFIIYLVVDVMFIKPRFKRGAIMKKYASITVNIDIVVICISLLFIINLIYSDIA